MVHDLYICASLPFGVPQGSILSTVLFFLQTEMFNKKGQTAQMYLHMALAKFRISRNYKLNTKQAVLLAKFDSTGF